MSWLQSGHHVVNFVYQVGILISAKQLKEYGSEYSLHPLRRS